MDPQIHRSWFVFCLISASILARIRTTHAAGGDSREDSHPDVTFHPSHLNAVVGRPFNVTCELSQNFITRTGFNSSSITFLTEEECPEHSAAEILDERRSRITFPSPHIIDHLHCYVHCIVNNMDEHTLSDQMYAGYPPMPVKSFEEIICNNWQDCSVVFNTNHSNLVYYDYYVLKYIVSSAHDSISNTSNCHPMSDNGDGIFVCDFDLASFDLEPNSILEYQIFGSNVVGNYSSDIYKISLSSTIKLRGVYNLNIKPLSAFSIRVCFDHNVRFPQNAIYFINMTSKYSSKSVNLSTTAFPLCHNFTLLNSFVKYKMKIRPYYKSSVYHNDDEILKARLTMPKSAPQAFPEISQSCFVISSLQQSVREVVVYWKSVPSQLIGADFLSYEITQVCGPRLQKFQTESNFFVFDKMPSNTACLVFVQAENEVGFRDGSIMNGIHIPAQDQLMREVRNLTALMLSNRSAVQLTWAYEQIEKVKSFTVYFCYGYQKCENNIGWIHFGPESREGVVIIPESWPMEYHTWLIGISADGFNGRSTGISWIPCLYSVDKRPPKPNFSVIMRGTTKANIKAMQPQCSKSLEGYVYGYSIGFCRSDGTQCNGDTITLLHERVNTGVIELKDLEPGAIYMLWGQSLSIDGPSFYNSTAVIFATEKEIFSTGPVIGMSILAVFLIICLLFGIYTCCRRGQYQWKTFKRKLHIDIHRPSAKSAYRNPQLPQPLGISDLAASHKEEEHRYVDIDDDGNEYIDHEINTARIFAPMDNLKDDRLAKSPMITKKIENSDTESLENFPASNDFEMGYLTGRTHVENTQLEFNINDYASDGSEQSVGGYMSDHQSALLLDSLPKWDSSTKSDSDDSSHHSLLLNPPTLNRAYDDDSSVISLVLDTPVMDSAN